MCPFDDASGSWPTWTKSFSSPRRDGGDFVFGDSVQSLAYCDAPLLLEVLLAVVGKTTTTRTMVMVLIVVVVAVVIESAFHIHSLENAVAVFAFVSPRISSFRSTLSLKLLVALVLHIYCWPFRGIDSADDQLKCSFSGGQFHRHCNYVHSRCSRASCHQSIVVDCMLLGSGQGGVYTALFLVHPSIPIPLALLIRVGLLFTNPSTTALHLVSQGSIHR